MATQKPTEIGYAEIAQLVSTVTTAMAAGGSGVESIVGLSGACTAAEDSAFANPGGATKLAANGFALVSIATVSREDSGIGVDDTVVCDHVFTCITAPQAVTGFAIVNDDDDLHFMEACFTEVPCEVDDTITIEAKMQFKIGA